MRKRIAETQRIRKREISHFAGRPLRKSEAEREDAGLLRSK